MHTYFFLQDFDIFLPFCILVTWYIELTVINIFVLMNTLTNFSKQKRQDYGFTLLTDYRFPDSWSSHLTFE